MKLFQTKFSFAEVLDISPAKHHTVNDRLTEVAWDRWAEANPAAHEQHNENAYSTIDTTQPEGYVVTIQVQAAVINLQRAREIYIATTGVRCPVCLSGDIAGGHIEVDAGDAIQEITCGQCGSTWTDRYNLVGIDSLLVNEGRE